MAPVMAAYTISAAYERVSTDIKSDAIKKMRFLFFNVICLAYRLNALLYRASLKKLKTLRGKADNRHEF